MTYKRRCISRALFKQIAQYLASKVNEKIDANDKITLSFLESWLQSFKSDGSGGAISCIGRVETLTTVQLLRSCQN